MTALLPAPLSPSATSTKFIDSVLSNAPDDVITNIVNMARPVSINPTLKTDIEILGAFNFIFEEHMKCAEELNVFCPRWNLFRYEHPIETSSFLDELDFSRYTPHCVCRKVSDKLLSDVYWYHHMDEDTSNEVLEEQVRYIDEQMKHYKIMVDNLCALLSTHEHLLPNLLNMHFPGARSFIQVWHKIYYSETREISPIFQRQDITLDEKIRLVASLDERINRTLFRYKHNVCDCSNSCMVCGGGTRAHFYMQKKEHVNLSVIKDMVKEYISIMQDIVYYLQDLKYETVHILEHGIDGDDESLVWDSDTEY